MNSIITAAAPNSSLTMSSREIAGICCARHNDVVETIQRLFDQEVLRESRKTTRTYRPEGGGRPTEVYDLTKRDTLVVVSGYNADVRAKIIDRWMELETKPAIPAGEHLNAQQTGGIVKAGLGKLKRELLAELVPQFTALAEELRTIHRPVGVAVVTHRTAKRWLDHYGITKRPKGLALRISNALARQSNRMGYAVSYTAEEEKRTFHEVVANAYFTVGAGRHLLPKAVKGQKEMRLEAATAPFAKASA